MSKQLCENPISETVQCKPLSTSNLIAQKRDSNIFFQKNTITYSKFEDQEKNTNQGCIKCGNKAFKKGYCWDCYKLYVWDT